MSDFPLCNSRYSIIWPLLYMAGIFGLSSLPDQDALDFSLNPLVWIPPDIQNFLHIPVFGGLACLWFWSLRHWFFESGYLYLLSILLTTVYGLFDEWHQTFVPGRYGTLTDVGFDAIGGVIGLLIYKSRSSLKKMDTESE